MADLLKVREQRKSCWGKIAIGLQCTVHFGGSGVNDVLIHCPTFACCSLKITIIVSKHGRTSVV